MAAALLYVTDVVKPRIAQLHKDIEEAEALLADYRKELEILLKISAMIDPSNPPSVSTPSPERYQNWDRLPPRFVQFLEHFERAERISRDEIRRWVRKKNPRIRPNSLITSTCEYARVLVNRGLLKPVREGVWTFVR